ncbi:hypothetical protein, partial [Yersinia enterocolitica]|uniref:hypothetical protein n=1 Tax=Yersinia enterocolitica TaxID=630 RepID=UPI001E4E7992
CLTIAVARPQGVLTNQKGFLYPAQSWKLYGTPSLAGGFLCTIKTPARGWRWCFLYILNREIKMR